MGWTSYYADTVNGKVDRKAEIDKLWEQNEYDSKDWNGNPHHYPQLRVLKSKMIGSTWYGVIESTDSAKGTVERFADIVLTSTKWNDGMNFGYKGIGSYYSGDTKFPKAWLNLLSEPTEEVDKKWRRDCIEAQSKPSLASLPIGTIIEYTSEYSGETTRLYKHEPAYQFKRPFWMIVGEHRYISTKYIPTNYRVVES